MFSIHLDGAFGRQNIAAAATILSLGLGVGTNLIARTPLTAQQRQQLSQDLHTALDRVRDATPKAEDFEGMENWSTLKRVTTYAMFGGLYGFSGPAVAIKKMKELGGDTSRFSGAEAGVLMFLTAPIGIPLAVAGVALGAAAGVPVSGYMALKQLVKRGHWKLRTLKSRLTDSPELHALRKKFTNAYQERQRVFGLIACKHNEGIAPQKLLVLMDVVQERLKSMLQVAEERTSGSAEGVTLPFSVKDLSLLKAISFASDSDPLRGEINRRLTTLLQRITIALKNAKETAVRERYKTLVEDAKQTADDALMVLLECYQSYARTLTANTSDSH